MSSNKKIWYLFLIFVLIPVLVPLLFGCVSQGKYFYQYTCSATSFLLFSFLPLIGGIAILFINHKSGYKSKAWYAVSAIVIVISVIYLFSIYSLSYFGF